MNKDSVVIITGANSGMGKAAAIELAKTGAHIVMVCRNQARGEAALREVHEKTGNQQVVVMLADLGSQESIRSFCTTFKKKYQRLDILINNAGVILPGRHETIDGFELQFGVNHLGHFLLTNLLLDLMSTSARIIVVSSGAHKIGKIHFKDINLTKNYRLWRAYAQSKLANILFTYELSRRLEGTGITANCLHPGAVGTSMGINRESGFGTFITKLLKPFFQTPEQGAETAVFLATSAEVSQLSGKYFYRKKEIRSSNRSHDLNLANKLWIKSEEWTGINTS